MTNRPHLVAPSDAEIGLWEQRIRAAAPRRMSLPTFKEGYCYVTYEIDGVRALIRVPDGRSLDEMEVLVDPRSFARPGERVALQSWRFLTDDTIAFCLADETENGVLRFLDVRHGKLVGRAIDNFRWGALAYSKAGDALYYTVRRPAPLTPGPVDWKVRTGGLDGPDTTIPAPDQPTGSETPQWPGFSVHEDAGHQWLVAMGSYAGELKHLYLADLSAPGSSPEQPSYTSSLRTTMRGALASRDGTATFISTDMGRLPQGAVFQARISSLTDRASWRQLIHMPDAPGAHLNSVRWVGTGEQTRLLVHRTQAGADALDVRAQDGKLLYSIDGPPDGRTGALYGVASGAPARKVGRYTRLMQRLRLARSTEPPSSVYLSWGDVVGSQTHEYRLGDDGPDIRQWPLGQEAAARAPQDLETVTRVWRAPCADGKTATARLVLAAGTDPSRSIGTVVEQYSHYATPQGPAGGFGAPQPYASTWLRHGGGVLTVMLQDPVTHATEQDVPAGIAAILMSGATAGLLRPETTVLTGTSTAASAVALMLQEQPGLFGLGVGLHGVFSRGEQAAQVGVGPNNAHDWALGPPTAAVLHGGIERLKRHTASHPTRCGASSTRTLVPRTRASCPTTTASRTPRSFVSRAPKHSS